MTTPKTTNDETKENLKEIGKAKSTQDNHIIFFTRITEFVNEMCSMYGSKYHQLRLYKHMLYKTNLSNKIKINRNIELFTAFLFKHKQSILKKDTPTENIIFSKNIYVPLVEIFKQADNDNKEVIFQHLVALLSCVDQSKEVSDMFKEILNPASKEGEFFNNILSKIEKNVSPNESENPMSALSSLMKGNVVQDIISSMTTGVKDGSLDLGKMFGMVQGLMGNLSPEMGNMVKNMASSLAEKTEISEKTENT